MAVKNLYMLIFALLLLEHLAIGFFIKNENTSTDEDSERDMRATTEYACFPWVFNPGEINTFQFLRIKNSNCF